MNEHSAPLLETLGHVQVDVSASVGAARVPLGTAAAFTTGTLVRLDCAADAPVTLMVNGVAVARGDLVLTDDDELAVEISDVGL